MAILTGYLGTYDSPRSRGVFRFSFDGETGALTAPELLLEAPDAKYLALRDGLLAAPVRRGSPRGALPRRPARLRRALRRRIPLRDDARLLYRL